MSKVAGHVVTIDTNSLHVPSACCRCGQPGTDSVRNSIRFGNTTRWLDLPYCRACKERSEQVSRSRTKVYVLSSLVAVVVSALGVVAPSLPLTALIAVPCVMAVVVASIFRRNAGASVDFPFGAWMVKANRRTSTFFCMHDAWAQQLAAANNVQAAAAKMGHPVRPWLAAIIIAGCASLYVAIACKPDIHVDVAGPRPLQIWLDGKPSIVADPVTGNTPRPTIAVPYGGHRFGWSPVGADKPAGETAEVQVKWMGKHLYNPASSTCYDLWLSTYGSAKGEGMDFGPQPVHEFYTFKSVDNWFKENPHTVSTKSSGATRTAVMENRMCRDLADLGCGIAIRTDLVECLRASSSDAGDATCVQRATAACKSPRK